MNRNAGFTLVELIVVLVIVAVTYSAVGLAIRSSEGRSNDGVLAATAVARREAIRTGRVVTIALAGGDSVSFYPDGTAAPSVIRGGDREWAVDQWTGQVRRAE